MPWFILPSVLWKAQHRLENVAARLSLHLLYASPCPVKTQQWAHEWKSSFLLKNHSNETEEQNVSPPPVKNFTTLVASEYSENFCLLSLVVLAKVTLLASSLQTLAGADTAEQANRLWSDSCINKACCAFWILWHLHRCVWGRSTKEEYGRRRRGGRRCIGGLNHYSVLLSEACGGLYNSTLMPWSDEVWPRLKRYTTKVRMRPLILSSCSAVPRFYQFLERYLRSLFQIRSSSYDTALGQEGHRWVRFSAATASFLPRF